ncbi:Ferric reductase transmembrane component, putative [Candida maltosa Xu316]|uniref:ferric-chelate reductase (NADPH) n=1 Tax=Candida maltosa (strain Xu316) TaxID=1245528 RepID=M3K267_CANMX|nr:Ferric reductase transmembrane component, putative [Candida maltosa Xu316]
MDKTVTGSDEFIGYYSCACTNPNALATLAGCIGYNNRNTSAVLKAAAHGCKEWGKVTLNKTWFELSYQYYLDHAVDVADIPDFNASEIVDVPIKLNGTEIEHLYEGYVYFLGNYDDSVYYGSGALAYWCVIMILGAINTWSRFLFPGLIKKLSFGPINWWREYVSMPATFRKKKAQEQKLFKLFDCLIPARYETIVIFLFYVYILVVHCVRYHYVPGAVFNTRFSYEVRAVADRTGIVPTIMMPLVFLYAGRNNIMQWFTGWNYSTFMTYHRHLARIMAILVIIHSFTFSLSLGKFYSEDMKETYLIWGTIGTVAGGIILFQAMLFFRRRWYEIFLLIHIVMAALYVAGTWIHVSELGYAQFCYATIAPWCFDRIIRMVRLFAFGFPKAKVTLLANETIKVEIPKPSYWKSIPGGHAFIHFLKPTYFWQSHPFTYVDSPDNSHIILFCKVKGGITHSLYRLLAKSPGQATTIRVGVEGPYGEPTTAKYADSAVFIAGGNGIPGMYSEIMDIARHQSSRASIKSLKLFWVIRDYKSLEWFGNELEALKDTPIETTIYVTRPDQVSEVTSEKVVEDDSVTKLKTDGIDSFNSDIKSRFGHIEFKHGRPSIQEIVVEQIQESAGSIAFVACGHPAMVDEVRYFACKNISNPEKKRVDFFEQVQVWA